MLYRRAWALACHTRLREGFPRRAIGYACAHPLCRSRAPALDPFGIRRSRTTVSGARERSRGTGPRATICKAVSLYRRARACPSPCLDQNEKRRWSACVFRADRAIAGDRPPRYDLQGRLRLTVGRGPVPRRASIVEKALVGVHFSRGSDDRGGQAPALR